MWPIHLILCEKYSLIIRVVDRNFKTSKFFENVIFEDRKTKNNSKFNTSIKKDDQIKNFKSQNLAHKNKF